MFNFVNKGADEALVKAMAEDELHTYDEEELNKALDKTKLVQREVQVKGKGGKTHTRKQWVKAGEDQPADKQPNQDQPDDKQTWSKVATKEEAKQQIVQALAANGGDRNALMSDFKNQGVSWKENDHEGINWMRACMAMNKHLTGSSQSVKSDEIADAVKKNAKPYVNDLGIEVSLPYYFSNWDFRTNMHSRQRVDVVNVNIDELTDDDEAKSLAQSGDWVIGFGVNGDVDVKLRIPYNYTPYEDLTDEQKDLPWKERWNKGLGCDEIIFTHLDTKLANTVLLSGRKELVDLLVDDSEELQQKFNTTIRENSMDYVITSNAIVRNYGLNAKKFLEDQNAPYRYKDAAVEFVLSHTTGKQRDDFIKQCVQDPSPVMRKIIASQHEGLEDLITDKNKDVRYTAMEKAKEISNFPWEKYGDHEEWRVRQAVAKQGHELSTLIYDDEPKVRKVAIKTALNNHDVEALNQIINDSDSFSLSEQKAAREELNSNNIPNKELKEMKELAEEYDGEITVDSQKAARKRCFEIANKFSPNAEVKRTDYCYEFEGDWDTVQKVVKKYGLDDLVDSSPDSLVSYSKDITLAGREGVLYCDNSYGPMLIGVAFGER